MADRREIQIDLLLNTANSAKSIKEVNESIEQLQSAAIEFGEGSNEFNRVTEAAGKLQRKVEDVNDAINAQKGSGFEKLTTQFGLLGESLLKLDFAKANEQIAGIGNTLQGLNFKSVAGGVKEFGQTMVNLGKTILANPILLLATVVIGIGVALISLKDSVKIVGIAFDVLTDILGGIVQLFKDLTDAIGLTTFAAEENAERQIESSKEVTSQLESDFDYQIQLAAAKGEETTQLEIQKTEALKKQYEKDLVNYQTLLNSKGDKDSEQYKELEAKIKETNDKIIGEERKKNIIIATENTKALEDAKATDAKELEEEKKKNDKIIADNKRKNEQIKRDNEITNNEIEDISLLFIEDEEERQIKQLELQAERRRKDIEERVGDEERQAELIFLLEAKLGNDIIAIQRKFDEDEANLRKESADKEIQDRITLGETRLAVEQTELEKENAAKLAAAELKLITAEEGSQAELEALREKLITERDIKLQEEGLTEEEIALIKEEYRQREAEAEEAFREQRIAKVQESLGQAQQFVSGLANLSNSIFDARLASINARYAAQLQGVKKGSQAEYEILVKQVKEENNVKRKQFEVNKKFQSANAAIATATAAISAFSALAPIPIVGPVLGAIAAAAAAAAGLAQIISINKQQFNATALPTQPSTSSLSGDLSSAANTGLLPTGPDAVLPNDFSLFGSGGKRSDNDIQGNNPDTGTGVRAYVVESDITDTQDRVSGYRTAVEIG